MENTAFAHSPSPFSLKSRYILVIEERTPELFYTAMLLQRFSYPVCTAQNATQALDMIAVALPALVVTDYSLHGTTGINFLKVLTSNPHVSTIPVIELLPEESSGREQGDRGRADTTWLQKPVAIEDLYCAVQAVLEHTPRTNIRVPTELPAIVNEVPLDAERGECVTHLSAQGLFIRTFKYHPPDEQISLQLEVRDRQINADARIIYTSRMTEGRFCEPGMAAKFVKISGEDREIIKKYVHDTVTKGIVAELDLVH